MREPYIWFEAGPYVVVNGDCDGDVEGYDGWFRWFGDADEAIWVMVSFDIKAYARTYLVCQQIRSPTSDRIVKGNLVQNELLFF